MGYEPSWDEMTCETWCLWADHVCNIGGKGADHEAGHVCSRVITSGVLRRPQHHVGPVISAHPTRIRGALSLSLSLALALSYSDIYTGLYLAHVISYYIYRNGVIQLMPKHFNTCLHIVLIIPSLIPQFLLMRRAIKLRIHANLHIQLC